MNKLLTIITIFSLITIDAFANDESKVRPSISVSYGYRLDNLNWNKASDLSGKATPNISKELTWEDLEIVELKADFKIPIIKIEADYDLSGYLFLDGSLGSGTIFNGTNQDSDYTGNHRSAESSRSNNTSDTGSTKDYALALAYKMPLLKDRSILKDGVDFFAISKFGYAIHEQDLRMTDGFKTIPATGSFSGLNSTYDTSWRGPFFGWGIVSYIKKHIIDISLAYHITTYEAEANWNLRTDLKHPKSFEHEAKGGGFDADIKYQYHITDNVTFDTSLNYRNFSAENGIDRTFFSSGTVTDVKLNEVYWNSTSLKLGITRTF